MKYYSIQQWCGLKNCSLSYYYRLRSAGKAPKLTKFGKAVRISEEADAEWDAANRDGIPSLSLKAA